MNLVFQCTHQSQVPRIVAYHRDPTFSVFPDHFGTEAVEVGPLVTPHQGPCLVLLKGVKATPAESLTWFQRSFLRRHVQRFYWLQASTAPANSQEELVAALVQLGAPDGIVRLQCHPRSLEGYLQKELPEQFQLHPLVFDLVLYVVCMDGKFWFHYHQAEYLYLKSNNSLKNLSDSCSTAVNKIEEAVEVLKISLHASSCVIDLGAAPGGWTSYLAQRAHTVIAVDPGEMSPDALQPNVHHIRAKAEQAGPQISQILSEDAAVSPADRSDTAPSCSDSHPVPSAHLLAVLEQAHHQLCSGAAPAAAMRRNGSKLYGGSGREQNANAIPAIDLLVSDMNMHPALAMQCIKELLPWLKPGGWAIMTAKFFGVGRDRTSWLERFKQILGPSEVHEVCCVWLMSNTVHERTFVAQKR